MTLQHHKVKAYGYMSRMGRPKKDTEAITLRLAKEDIAAIDAIRRKEDVPPSRPEMIRRLLHKVLAQEQSD